MESAFDPKGERQLDEKEWPKVTDRELEHIPHSSAINRVAVPNPDYQPGTLTPRYAAIRIADCVGEAGQQELLAGVQAIEDVG